MHPDTSQEDDLFREFLANASLETLLTNPIFFGLTTASPCQRAACRILDGVPLGKLQNHPDVRKMLKDVMPPEGAPQEVCVFSGVRVAKSMMAAAQAVRWSQRVELPSWLRPGDRPRIPILSLDKDKASAVYGHVVGSVMESPALRTLVMGRPTSEGITLRHPSGKPIDILVMAGKRAGAAVVAFWLAGIIFDEFPRMLGADEAVVNWDESRRAAKNRILPGGGICNIGSPYQPWGPAYDIAQTYFGRPTQELVVLWSDAPTMNPVYWTPERVAEAAASDPQAYATDVLAQFATPEESMYHADTLAMARTGTLEEPDEWPRDRMVYRAFMDPATRRNAWTLVIGYRNGLRWTVATAREWVGTKLVPLDPASVVRDIAAVCKRYRVTMIESDRYYVDAIVSLAHEHGITIAMSNMSETEKYAQAQALEARIAMGAVDLRYATTYMPLSRADTGKQAYSSQVTNNVLVDLQRVRRKPTPAGAVVSLPQTSDGRHCDFFPPLLMMSGAYLPYEPTATVRSEHDNYEKRIEKELRKKYT